MQSVATNMIVGDKPEPFAIYALKSTAWADEKVIVNTGAPNNQNILLTRKILPDAKIIQFNGGFDFSAARNLALENTESQWVIWQDYDECHFEAFEGLVRSFIHNPPGDGIQFAFYHFLLDMYHYQSIDPRVILFHKDGKKWYNKVHEEIKPLKQVFPHSYRYHHYGYVKPQHLIYENWRTYWSLNPPENFKLHEIRNPDDIISDRVSVAHLYTGEYPEVIKNDLNKFDVKIKDYKFIKEQ